MGNLILDSLEIQNFRTFQHLQIEKLGRVNLITGKNNVGKTSLLEAIYFYMNDGSAQSLSELLLSREEIPAGYSKITLGDLLSTDKLEILLQGLNNLFYGRKKLTKDVNSSIIMIGSIDSSQPFSMQIRREDFLTINKTVRESHSADRTSIGLVDFFNNLAFSEEISCKFIRASGLDRTSISSIWDQIALTDEEEQVLCTLRIIEPDIQRIGFIREGSERTPLVKLNEIDRPFPMRSMGEGLNLLFGIVLALMNTQNGILLIDEVDTGFHYSIQTEVWRLIFETAHRLNVQVFAATHSWDCIEAFQKAADEDKEDEGVLIRLLAKKNGIIATTYDERELKVATRELIEVR